MGYVLGIDQGGSKTCAVLADTDGTLLGFGKSAGACHSVQGMDKAMSAIVEAAEQACAGTGISPKETGHIFGGLTGIDWPEEGPLLRKTLAETFPADPEKITVVNDCMIALRAATENPRSCILCAGSGLNCGVRDGGREYVFGYYIPDDCQGGQALGWRTVQAVLDGESGLLPDTKLTSAVLCYLDCPSPEQLLRRRVAGELDQNLVLHLPKVLEQAALEGDSVANEVLKSFGEDIARYPAAALKRFRLTDQAVDVVLSGSLFKCRARVLQETVIAEIRKTAPTIHVIESVYEPVVGAVLGAFDRLGITPDELMKEKLLQSAKTLGLLRR